MPVPSDTPPAKLYHATPLRNWESIRERGLLAGRSSHPHRPEQGVYLSHQLGMAMHYAEMGFGSDDPEEPFAIIEIDGSALDVTKLRADDGAETEANHDDIVARGFSAEQVRAGDFPWWVSLEETGQVVYMADIPAAALTLEREFRPSPSPTP